MRSQPHSSESRGRIPDLLFASEHNSADAQALVGAGRACSYAELARYARSFAAQLRADGLQPGERVAVFLDKTVECVVAYWGTWIAGGVLVPINEGLKGNQISHIVDDAEPRFIVSDDRKRRALPAQTPTVIACRLDADNSVHVPEPSQDPDSAAVILYTSGSTGQPKGIVVSHDNLVAGARIVADYLELEHTDRILCLLPFSFDYGLNQLLIAAQRAATCVLQRSTLAPHVCTTLRDERISVLAAVPPFWVQLLGENSPFSDMDLPDLRIITNSGGHLPQPLIERLHAHMPQLRIFPMYGLSEAFRSTYLDPDMVLEKAGSIGKAIPETQLMVVDESGRECGIGEVGELVHDGPTVALGYWRNPEATEQVFREHPHDSESERKVVYSGDLMRRDADGFLYFVARGDAMIKSMGYRISPEDVEAQIFASGGVQEVVVGARPDPIAGQVVIAHIVASAAEQLDSDQILAFCRKNMPSYMVPHEIVMHGTFPRTTSGKVDRQAVLA